MTPLANPQDSRVYGVELAVGWYRSPTERIMRGGEKC